MIRRLAPVVALALLLSACEEPGATDSGVMAAGAEEQANVTGAVPALLPGSAMAAQTVTAAGERSRPLPATPTRASNPSTTATGAPPPGACVDPAMDLASTALGAWLASGVIPTDRPGQSYAFEVTDNQFSPCDDLSWVVLTGEVGEPAAAARDVVLFFTGPDLVTEPAPPLLPAGVGVDKRSDGAVRVTLPEAGEVEFRLTGSGLEATGELPETTHLDLGRAGPPTQDDLRPFGNAYTRPWKEERPRGQRYSMEMGEGRIVCDFELFNDLQLVCFSPTGTPWPMLEENVPAETGGEANVVILNFQSPWAVSTLADGSIARDAAAEALPEEALPEEAVTRIDDVFVDTRANVVKIYDSHRAYILGEGFAMPVDVPTAPIDTSRHPQDLRPWDPALN